MVQYATRVPPCICNKPHARARATEASITASIIVTFVAAMEFPAGKTTIISDLFTSWPGIPIGFSVRQGTYAYKSYKSG